MSTVTVRTKVAAPANVVFEVASDLAHAAEHISGIKKLELLTDGPIAVGTRFRETRVMFHKEATEEMQITRLEPGRTYTVECESCGAHYSSTFQVQPEGSGSEMEMRLEARPLTLFAKLMSPLGFLMAGMMKKCLEQDLDDVKRIAESRADTAVSRITAVG